MYENIFIPLFIFCVVTLMYCKKEIMKYKNPSIVHKEYRRRQEMNLKKQIMGIFKKKQEIKTEQKELTERIEKALYDTVGEKGFTPRPLTISHIDYSQEEIQIFLEAHYRDGTKLCDILRFIDELNVPYENVWFGLYKCEVTSFEGNLFLLIKLTEEATRK